MPSASCLARPVSRCLAARSLAARSLAARSLGIVLVAVLAGHAAADAPEPTTRWYELLRAGQKIGWSKVAWSASTWEGRPSLHDRTESVTRSARDMAGHRDVFETRTVIELERDADGSLWSQEVVVHEAGRRSVETLRWNGKAYLHSATVDGQEVTKVVPLDAPVSTDAEAFLSQRAREGTLTAGAKLSLRELDLEGLRARVSQVEVLGTEQVEGPSGPVEAVKVVLRHLETGSESWMWLDREGAFVRSESDTGMVLRRASEEQARKLPQRPPSFSITVRSEPPLERVMSADRLEIEVALAHDEARKLPEFPDSPWSKARPARRDARRGWIIPVTLTAYDDPSARAPLPIDPAGFERDLEPTPLMPCGHPDLVRTAREVIGDAADARTAAARLARWVCDELHKQSLDVAQGSALQILEERRGDCSEHALLFVALCRAAGIPARRCSGYVNIGPMWGAHAWAEVWCGRWIGADPTTGEVGGGARYLFFGYSDAPDSFPGVVSARIDGRISIRALAVEEDGVEWPLDPDDRDAIVSGETPERWIVHPATGLELRGIPEDWSVTVEHGRMIVRGPGIMAALAAEADQGQLMGESPGPRRTFAGVPARVFEQPGGRTWRVHSRRRHVQVAVRSSDDEALATFERIAAPSVAETVTRPEGLELEPGPDGRGFAGRWELDRPATVEQQATLLRGLSGVVRGAMRERLEQLVERCAAGLEVQPDGRYALEAAVPRGEQTVKVERESRWTLDGSRLDLGAASQDGARRLQGRLVARDRLTLELEDWTLVLTRR